MEIINSYVLAIRSSLYALSHLSYFYWIVFTFVIVLSFLVGRLFHEKKFNNLLSLINDAENTRKALHEQIANLNSSEKYLTSWLIYIKVATLISLLGVGLYTYFYSFRLLVICTFCGVVAAIWILIELRFKYLQIFHQRADKKLKMNSLSAESEIKQILNLIGPEVSNALKGKFEREIEAQWRLEEQKKCDLYKCYEEKGALRELYQLNKIIIEDMKQMQWCEVCHTQTNANTLDLKMNEVENNMRIYKRALEESDKFTIEKRKELTNRLLGEWEHLDKKIPHICKRGCCVRFKQVIEEIKYRHHGKLKQLKAKLSSI